MNNWTMQKSNNGNLHNGFYIFGKGNIKTELKEIDNPYLTEDLEDSDCVYYDAYIFLDGICHIFALTLHEIFGYEIYRINDEHWFCKSNYQGKDIYIDVRGATTDYEEFLDTVPTIGQNPKPEHYKDINYSDFKDDWEDIGSKFAKYIIAKEFDNYVFV